MSNTNFLTLIKKIENNPEKIQQKSQESKINSYNKNKKKYKKKKN